MSENSLRFSRNNLDPQIKDVSNWATVDTSLLSEEEALRIKNLKEAICEYLSHEPVDEICNNRNITKPWLLKIVKRCLEPHPDGRIWGFRALISNTRQKSYERISKNNKNKNSKHGGHSGELSRLFNSYPHIKELVINLFLKESRQNTIHEARISFQSIHKRFIDACRQASIMPNSYPFTVENLGYTSLWKYLKKLFSQEQEKATKARYGKEVARSLKLQSADESKQDIVTRPYQRVEFDAHEIDAFFTIMIPSIYGGFTEKVLERILLLTIIDVCTRAVIGYHISFRRQYSGDDVLLCVKNAITPWKPRILSIPELEYSERGGFPSGAFKEMEWALWEELAYDNAKSNLAQKVRNRITSVVNYAINAGPIRTPERRPFIERFFGTLEENGFHRLPSTTGGNAKDSRRDNPEEKALQYHISLEHLEELTDVMIANYNGTPHTGIGYRSPLEFLSYHINSGTILPRQISKSQHNNLGLLNIEVTRPIRGNASSGVSPHINYEGVKYRNEVLSRSPDLVGTKLTLIIDTADPRSITAFLPSGAEFGVLTAQGVWGRSPHTLEQRKSVLLLKKKRLIHYTESDDPIQKYLNHLERQSLKSKSARGKLADVRRTRKVKNAVAKQEREVLSKNKKESSLEEESNTQEELPRLKTFTY